MIEYITVKLKESVKKIDFDGIAVLENHPKLHNCYHASIEQANGIIIVTAWKNKINEIIYQMPTPTIRKSKQRNKFLFKAYGDGLEFIETLDNGFGKSYWRSDKKVFALWSYTMDFITFGTAEFHKVKWK